LMWPLVFEIRSFAVKLDSRSTLMLFILRPKVEDPGYGGVTSKSLANFCLSLFGREKTDSVKLMLAHLSPKS